MHTPGSTVCCALCILYTVYCAQSGILVDLFTSSIHSVNITLRIDIVKQLFTVSTLRMALATSSASKPSFLNYNYVFSHYNYTTSTSLPADCMQPDNLSFMHPLPALL